MPITRINRFVAKSDSAEKLQAFMEEVIRNVQTLPGCRSVKLLHSTERPENFAIIEEWDSIDDHKRAAATATQATLDKVRALIAKPPVGEYFQ